MPGQPPGSSSPLTCYLPHFIMSDKPISWKHVNAAQRREYKAAKHEKEIQQPPANGKHAASAGVSPRKKWVAQLITSQRDNSTFTPLKMPIRGKARPQPLPKWTLKPGPTQKQATPMTPETEDDATSQASDNEAAVVLMLLSKGAGIQATTNRDHPR